MKYVNLGCGSRYHSEWVNFDISAHSPGIIACDLSRGIPLADAECDAVYHSALLEHLRRADALFFMRECHRVLKPGGILRAAVPDLERICRLYSQKLEAALAGDAQAACDYRWILLELYDQAVRERSGGEMLDYLNQKPLPHESFVYERIGEEGRELVDSLQQSARKTPQGGNVSLKRSLRRMAALPRKIALKMLLGQSGLRALEIGRFRLAGEVHQWMYDRYSLSELLSAVGFQAPIQQSAAQSQIVGWSDFHLDTLPDGTIIKPDSLFMEAIKPAA